MGTTLGRIFLSLFTLLFIVPILLVRCQPRAEGGTGILVRLHRVDQRRTYIMDLEEYLKGVVAAEMPAAFHPEALKAQAVAARTVTVRRLLRYGGKGSKYDPSADFSDDPVEGQAWLSQRDLRRRWGWRAYSANWAKVSRAVEETKGLILTYQGRPIDAVYHSTSGPRTEAAQDVWGRAVPYLQSVACPYDRHSPRYRQTVRFTPGELARRLGVRLPGQGVAGTLPVATGGQGVQVLERSSGGRAKLIRAGDVIFRGEEFRRRLGLRSTHLALWESKGHVLIETVGYGHGVGLCQYGADGMARQGADFRRILQHYYKGVEIRRLVAKSAK